MNKNIIAIINHGTGNIKSISYAIHSLGEDMKIVNSAADLKGASHIIIPGVGHFGAAMKSLKNTHLDQAIHEHITNHTPILGICLGMQLLFESSEEGGCNGFNLFPGGVVKKQPSNKSKFRIPNVGWVKIDPIEYSGLFVGIDPDDLIFYFANTYGVKYDVSEYATSIYNFEDHFIASVQKDNIYGTQFHPEKSGKVGLSLLKNFINSCQP